ncbi:MAG TPA: phosphate ABC transporter substrate-binding protein [Ignavibacteriaceae bacterium]|nr:phosphate ABC transporter substrate-binding protein [Ignavibacteriaceae bacterium]
MKIIFKLFITFSVIILNACSANITETNSFTISGSDTMFDLTSNLAAEYMKEHPGISINVIGGGTASGIRALIKGETDICTASRNLKPDEAKALADYYNSLGMVYLIAKDGLSIYLHPGNNVKNLSMSQLKDIFTGKINNWKVLGGKDTVIIPVIRNPNSGTYLYFKEHVLEDEEYSPNCLIEPTTKEIAKFVSEHTNAIGYGGMGYSLNVFNAAINGVEPLEKNIHNDTYPISRYLHFYTTKNPKGLIKDFIDWVLSPAGQSVVRKSGYIPLWENQL